MKKITLCFLIHAGFLTVLSAQNPTATNRIFPQAIHEKPISPLIYGNFIELGLARQIEGLWAEKLYHAGFEEVPPLKANLWDWLGKAPGDNLSLEKWWHSGYEINDWYSWPLVDEVKKGTNRYWNFHHGLQAAVLENGQKTGRAFLAQDGIWIDSGVRYLFRGYFSNNKTADPNPDPVKVTIGLYSGKQIDKPLAEQTIIVPDGIFREFSVELDPGSYKGRTTFAEAYRRFGWEEYAKRCVEYSKSMKAADPDIKLVMVGYWKYSNNLGEMLDIAGRVFELMSRIPLRYVIQTDTIKNLPGVFIQTGVAQIPNPKDQKTNKLQNSKLKTGALSSPLMLGPLRLFLHPFLSSPRTRGPFLTTPE